MTVEQRVIVSAQEIGWIGPGDRMIKHPAYRGAINSPSVNTETNDAPAPLVDETLVE